MESDSLQAHYEAVLKDLQEKKEREIQELTQKVNQKYSVLMAGIQTILTGAPLGEAPLTAQGDVSPSPAAGSANGGEIRIMTGEFHGMSYTAATRAILDRSPNKA